MGIREFLRLLKQVLHLKRKPPKRKKRRRVFKPKKKRNSKTVHKPPRIAVSKKQKKKKKPVSLTSHKPAKKKEPKALEIGTVVHYFPNVKAAVVKLKKPLNFGEPVWIKGKTTDLRLTVSSMQIDRRPIEKARAGQEIGLGVFRDVRPGDVVYILKG